MLARGEPVRDVERSYHGPSWSGPDITKRKQAELASQESETGFSHSGRKRAAVGVDVSA